MAPKEKPVMCSMPDVSTSETRDHDGKPLLKPSGISLWTVVAVGGLMIVGGSLAFCGGRFIANAQCGDWIETWADGCARGGFSDGFFRADGSWVRGNMADRCEVPPKLHGLRFELQGSAPRFLGSSFTWEKEESCEWYKISKRRAPTATSPGGVWQDGPAVCGYSRSHAPTAGPCMVIPGFDHTEQPVKKTWLSGSGATPLLDASASLSHGTEVQVRTPWKDTKEEHWYNAVIEYKVQPDEMFRMDVSCNGGCYKVGFHDDNSWDYVNATDIRRRPSFEEASRVAGGPVDFANGDLNHHMEIKVSCGRSPPPRSAVCAADHKAPPTWGQHAPVDRTFCESGWKDAIWGPWSDVLNFKVTDCRSDRQWLAFPDCAVGGKVRLLRYTYHAGSQWYEL